MKLDLNLTGVDLDAAKSGTWIPYDNGIEFRIARSTNTGYLAAIKKMQANYRVQLEQKTLQDETATKLMAEIMADHILTDWKGMKNGKEDFPYTRENAMAFLEAEQYTDIRDWIMVQAQTASNFHEKKVKKQ